MKVTALVAMITAVLGAVNKSYRHIQDPYARQSYEDAEKSYLQLGERGVLEINRNLGHYRASFFQADSLATRYPDTRILWGQLSDFENRFYGRGHEELILSLVTLLKKTGVLLLEGYESVFEKHKVALEHEALRVHSQV